MGMIAQNGAADLSSWYCPQGK